MQQLLTCLNFTWDSEDLFCWCKQQQKKDFYQLSAVQAAENHGDEWGSTWYLQWGIYISTPTWIHSQNSFAAAEALNLKICLHGTSLKWSWSVVFRVPLEPVFLGSQKMSPNKLSSALSKSSFFIKQLTYKFFLWNLSKAVHLSSIVWPQKNTEIAWENMSSYFCPTPPLLFDFYKDCKISTCRFFQDM